MSMQLIVRDTLKMIQIRRNTW